MVSSPEEYFSTQDFSPTSSQTEYSPAERLFMMKYLGLSGDDLLNKKLKITEPIQPEAAPAAQSPLAGSEYINDIAFDPAQGELESAPANAAFIRKAVESETEDAQITAAPEPESGAVSSAKAAEPSVPLSGGQPDQTQLVQAQPERQVQPETAETAAPTPVEEHVEAASAEAASSAPAAPDTSTEPMQQTQPAPEEPARQVAAAPTVVEAPVQPEKVPTEQPVEPETASPEGAKPTAAAQPLKEAEPIRIRSPLEITREEFEAVKAAEPALETMLKQEEHCQMVAFFIGDQEFVIPTMAMQEVIRFETPIRIPMAPQFVEGVISLRGRVTPVVNLRDMLEVVNKPLEANNKCIIICMRRGIQLGFVVEKIHTMYWVSQSNLEWGVEAQLGINSDVDFISAVMKSEDGLRLLGMISVDKIIDYILR